ncbi:MAG TPA: class I SAM-dependent methyltransferase [Dehalococcoidia bacterium]|nr:class I SAM-dependent methyltransferase [Dehalococcoidia bacterium]
MSPDIPAHRICTVNFHLFRPRPGQLILDLGCGDGRHTVQACRRAPCRVVAVDVDREDLRRVRYMMGVERWKGLALGQADFILANACHLPFADGTFDKVICTEVLEHVSDDRASLVEIARVLRPGGRLALSVPAWPGEAFLRALSPLYPIHARGHRRAYLPGELRALLARRGLRVYNARYRHAYESLRWLAYVLAGFRREATLPRLLQDFWERAVTQPGRYWDVVEGAANFLFPKSLVLYAIKGKAEGPPVREPNRERSRDVQGARAGGLC